MEPQKDVSPIPLPEIVNIDRDFSLFKSDRTKPKWNSGHETNLLLQVDDTEVPKIPFHVYTTTGTTSRHNVFTPFNPELGHTISGKDFNLQARREWINTPGNISEAPEEMFHVDASNVLTISGTIDNLKKNEQTERYEIPSDSYLSRMRLVLSFPNGIVLEALPSVVQTKKVGQVKPNRIEFKYFYPADFNSLAAEYEDLFVRGGLTNGLSVFLPNDLAKLSEINARFRIEKNSDSSRT